MSLESNKKDPALGSSQLEEIKMQLNKERRWYPKAKIIADFHREKVNKWTDKRNIGWKLRDTCRVLGISIGYASESIRMVEFIEKNEGIARWDKCSREMVIKIMKGNEVN